MHYGSCDDTEWVWKAPLGENDSVACYGTRQYVPGILVASTVHYSDTIPAGARLRVVNSTTTV